MRIRKNVSPELGCGFRLRASEFAPLEWPSTLDSLFNFAREYSFMTTQNGGFALCEGGVIRARSVILLSQWNFAPET